MSEPRNFDEEANLAEKKEKNSRTFILGGQEFHTKGYSPAATFVKGVDEASGAGVLFEFIASLLVKEDRERFLALVQDPDAEVDIEQVTEISNWLVEINSANRPTNAPS